MREIREKEGVSDPNPEETGPIGGPHIEDIRKYSETKADYTNSKKFSEDSERRLAAETVRIKMTGSPVKIWEKAEPSVYPSKPNVPLIMCLAAGAGVFMGFVFSGIFLLCVCLQRKQPVAS